MHILRGYSLTDREIVDGINICLRILSMPYGALDNPGTIRQAAD